jgi:hypothetical protein
VKRVERRKRVRDELEEEEEGIKLKGRGEQEGIG